MNELVERSKDCFELACVYSILSLAAKKLKDQDSAERLAAFSVYYVAEGIKWLALSADEKEK